MAHCFYLSWCLQKVGFYWNFQHKQGFQVAMARNPKSPLKWPKCARLPCENANLPQLPVSRAYPGGGLNIVIFFWSEIPTKQRFSAWHWLDQRGIPDNSYPLDRWGGKRRFNPWAKKEIVKQMVLKSPPPLPRSWFLGRGGDEALFSEKKRVFQWKGGRQFSEWGVSTGEAIQLKRSRRFSEPPDSEKWKVAVLLPFPTVHPPYHPLIDNHCLVLKSLKSILSR